HRRIGSDVEHADANSAATAAAAAINGNHSARYGRHNRGHTAMKAVGKGILRRRHLLATATTLVAIGAIVGCKGAETTKAATTPIGMVVGPENIAVVKAEQLRSGPAISGNLEPEFQATVRAEIGGAILQTKAEQGDRVGAGAELARIDDAVLREAELA